VATRHPGPREEKGESGAQNVGPAPGPGVRAVKSLYELNTKTLDGKPADLGIYRGKVSLVVNAASKCGYTSQYEELEKLHRETSPKGFNVLGFRSNDFGGQEPGTVEEIQTFQPGIFRST
jgi:glutathione peroxidase-family protein